MCLHTDNWSRALQQSTYCNLIHDICFSVLSCWWWLNWFYNPITDLSLQFKTQGSKEAVLFTLRTRPRMSIWVRSCTSYIELDNHRVVPKAIWIIVVMLKNSFTWFILIPYIIFSWLTHYLITCYSKMYKGNLIREPTEYQYCHVKLT